MQFEGKAAVRDVIAHKDLGVASGQVLHNVSAHDVAVLVLTPHAAVESAEGDASADAAWAARWKGHGIRHPQSRREWEARKLVVSRAAARSPL